MLDRSMTDPTPMTEAETAAFYAAFEASHPVVEHLDMAPDLAAQIVALAAQMAAMAAQMALLADAVRKEDRA